MTIPQVNRLEGRPGPPRGKGPACRRFLLGGSHPQLPRAVRSARGDPTSLFMRELVDTWCLNGGGEMVTAYCHRTLRTPRGAK